MRVLCVRVECIAVVLECFSCSFGVHGYVVVSALFSCSGQYCVYVLLLVWSCLSCVCCCPSCVLNVFVCCVCLGMMVASCVVMYDVCSLCH